VAGGGSREESSRNGPESLPKFIAALNERKMPAGRWGEEGQGSRDLEGLSRESQLVEGEGRLLVRGCCSRTRTEKKGACRRVG